MADRSTRVTQHVRASRQQVYRALIDADAVAIWMVPDGMTSQVHEFDAREGGRFRISLTYDEPTGTGKSTAHTDTFHGRFTRLLPDQEVVEVIEFESDDAVMRGKMTVTLLLSDANGGTDVVGVHEDLPAGVLPADNETGWRMSLAKLASLVERGGLSREVAVPPGRSRIY